MAMIFKWLFFYFVSGDAAPTLFFAWESGAQCSTAQTCQNAPFLVRMGWNRIDCAGRQNPPLNRHKLSAPKGAVLRPNTAPFWLFGGSYGRVGGKFSHAKSAIEHKRRYVHPFAKVNVQCCVAR